MSTATFLRQLHVAGACSDGYNWARTEQVTSVEDAWNRLQRADWMLWLAVPFRIELDDEVLCQFDFECAARGAGPNPREAEQRWQADRLRELFPAILAGPR